MADAETAARAGGRMWTMEGLGADEWVIGVVGDDHWVRNAIRVGGRERAQFIVDALNAAEQRAELDAKFWRVVGDTPVGTIGMDLTIDNFRMAATIIDPDAPSEAGKAVLRDLGAILSGDEILNAAAAMEQAKAETGDARNAVPGLMAKKRAAENK